MKTIVLQSFRTSNVPAWMDRCMASVRDWSKLQGYDYEFMDDRIFDLCGTDYLSQVGDNKRSITNLARLELIKLRLAGDYERAVWLDADTFVFAPAALRVDIDAGYAFAREVWVTRDEAGRTFVRHGVHNACCVFTRDQPDLEFLIRTARYIAGTRRIRASYQVGVQLLSGLQYPLSFPLLQDNGMFSPDIVHALATGEDSLLATLARGHAHPVHAANLCFALSNPPDPRWPWIAQADDIIMAAMDRLEQTTGAVINRFLAASTVAANAGQITAATTEPSRGKQEPSYHIDSPAWLLAQALRLLLVRSLPTSLAGALRRSRASVAGEAVSP